MQILTALAKYGQESILEKTRVGQLMAAANSKRTGFPKGLDAEKFAEVIKVVERGLSVAETVSITLIGLYTVKCYRKQFERLPGRSPESK